MWDLEWPLLHTFTPSHQRHTYCASSKSKANVSYFAKGSIFFILRETLAVEEIANNMFYRHTDMITIDNQRTAASTFPHTVAKWCTMAKWLCTRPLVCGPLSAGPPLPGQYSSWSHTHHRGHCHKSTCRRQQALHTNQRDYNNTPLLGHCAPSRGWWGREGRGWEGVRGWWEREGGGWEGACEGMVGKRRGRVWGCEAQDVKGVHLVYEKEVFCVVDEMLYYDCRFSKRWLCTRLCHQSKYHQCFHDKLSVFRLRETV